MPDTGASQSIVSANVARDANLSITPTPTELRNASNIVMRLVGEARVILCNNRHSAVTTVLVSPELNHNALIGWQELQRLRVVPNSFPTVAVVASCFTSLRTKTLSAFSQVFSDSLDNKPMCADRMKIFLKPNSVPYRISSPGLFPYVSKRRPIQKSPSMLLQVSSSLAPSPQIGAHRHSLCQKLTASRYAW